jgi:hypothetical protein
MQSRRRFVEREAVEPGEQVGDVDAQSMVPDAFDRLRGDAMDPA